MDKNLPEGFIDLVKLVIKEDSSSTRKIPKTAADIWYSFLWGVFLNGIRIDAEINYMHEIFTENNLLDLDVVSNLTVEELKESIRKYAKNKLKGSRVEGRKKATIKLLLNEEELTKTAKSIKEMSIYFTENEVSRKFLEGKTRNEKDTEKFIGELSYKDDTKIFGVGTVRAILWLQPFGLSNDFCPPSTQVMNFVDEDIEKKDYMERKKRGKYYDDIDNKIRDWEYIVKVRNLTRNVINPVIKNATPRDVGKAIWYFKSTQSLLSKLREGLKDKFTPRTLLEFIKEQKFTLENLAENIGDINNVNELTKDLRQFVIDDKE